MYIKTKQDIVLKIIMIKNTANNSCTDDEKDKSIGELTFMHNDKIFLYNSNGQYTVKRHNVIRIWRNLLTKSFLTQIDGKNQQNLFKFKESALKKVCETSPREPSERNPKNRSHRSAP